MAGQRRWTDEQERWGFLKAAGQESFGVQRTATTWSFVLLILNMEYIAVQAREEDISTFLMH